MFGTSIEFSGLPTELQYAAIAGAIIGGAIYAYIKGRQAGQAPSAPATPPTTAATHGFSDYVALLAMKES